MSWRLIFLLSLLGVAAGFTTLCISSVKGEQVVWLIVFLISAFIIARFADGKYFLNGLVLGIIDYMLAACIHVVCYNVYAQHHKEIIAVTENPEQTLNPRVALLIIETVKGLLMALAQGGFAFVIGRGMNKAFNRN